MAAKPESAHGKAASGMPDFTSLFANLKMPSLGDVEPLLRAHQRNMEALAAANRVALEGAQAYAKRHMEIVQQSLSELTQSLQTLAQPGSPQAKAAAQVELIKHAYEHTVSNMKELGDLIQRSNNEAIQLLNHRFAEAMDDIKTMMAKVQQKAP
ncbi:MAG TPA: phasin family protein [Acetobacteraceae bacterium]|nr:phasin family protein [Acetobacteraceae bacterium]